MLALCGVLKVNDYVNNSFNIAVNKWKTSVDLSERLYAYLDNLNYASRSLIEGDIEKYLEKGPLDSIEIIIDSGESLYIMVTRMMREYLCKYLQADYRIIRIRFKFMNRLDKCTYLDTELSGDYLLVPALCKTYTEEIAAENWCKETLKSICQKLYKKYGTYLSEEQTLEMLGINEQSHIEDLKRIYQQIAEASGISSYTNPSSEEGEEDVIDSEEVEPFNEDDESTIEGYSDSDDLETQEESANDDILSDISVNVDISGDVASTDEANEDEINEQISDDLESNTNEVDTSKNTEAEIFIKEEPAPKKSRLIMYPDDDEDEFY